MNEINTIPIFPSLLSHIKCDDFEEIKEDLIEWCLNYKKSNKSVQLSNIGGWQSVDNFDWDKENFTRYGKYISNNVGSAIGHFLSEEKCSKYYITNIWANINGTNHYNDMHNHPEACLSGVLWVSCPEKSGNFVFENPNVYGQHSILTAAKDDVQESLNYYHTLYFTPKDGQMLIFPSDLRHCVRPNKSDQDRITISFNINIL
jgi:uncharacterized protein (TIGR02466 family)